MNGIETSTIASTRTAIQERQTTAVRLAEQFFERIAKDDQQIHSYLHVAREKALAQATNMDALVDKGEPVPPLGGVVGLKPTYGRVSRYGLIAFASSLDHIGPFTNTVADAALVLRTMAGKDVMDSTSADVPVPDYVAELEKPVRGLRIGIPKEYFAEGLAPDVRAAVEEAIQQLAKAGCEVVEVSLPN